MGFAVRLLQTERQQAHANSRNLRSLALLVTTLNIDLIEGLAHQFASFTFLPHNPPHHFPARHRQRAAEAVVDFRVAGPRRIGWKPILRHNRPHHFATRYRQGAAEAVVDLRVGGDA